MTAASTLLRRRTRLLAVPLVGGLVAALLGPVGSAPSAGSPQPPAAVTAVPGGPGAVFDPTSIGWHSYSDQTSAQFSDTFNERKKQSLPVDLEIDVAGGKYRVGSVWQSNLDHRGWREKRNLTAAQYKAYWEKARDDGYRLIEHETYVVGGVRLYAGIWIRNLEGYSWASRRGQTSSQFSDTIEDYSADGLMPIDIDHWISGSSSRWSTVWVQQQVRDWQLVRNVTAGQWAATFEALSGRYRVLSFDSVRTANGQRYSGIWVSNDSGRGWAFRRDMTKKGYVNWWYRYRDLGYRPVMVDRYETANGTRYAFAWRQNSDRPNWTHREDVDAAVADELDAAGFPGAGVAIYENGVARYTRGFGYANVDDGWWMDSTHTGQLASISKAIGGVLTFRMIERGELELDDRTRTWVPAMPTRHRHTIGQLVSNRGCVRHYSQGSNGFEGDDFDTALEAAEEFWDDPLLCNPATETEYHYSTHGYTLLGAALEAAGGDDIKDLVRKRLTNPYSLGTVGVQRFSGHRMTPYDADGDEISTPVNDWKVLGGGLDASTAHLARFGDKLLRGEILEPTTLTDMWTDPDTEKSYAYGWITGTQSSNDYVSKDGLGKGATTYLLLYPDLGITIAVLGNGRGDDGFAKRLAHRIGGLLIPS